MLHADVIPQIWPVDLGYHAYEPQYEDHGCIDRACKLLHGKPCYYDGSTMNAEQLGQRVFAARGVRPEELLWPELEEYYQEVFA